MEPFVYQSQAQRIVFGSGTLAAAGEELARLGCSRAFVLTTPQQSESAEDLARNLGAHCVGRVHRRGHAHAGRGDRDGAGGRPKGRRPTASWRSAADRRPGSAKAIALRTDLPQIVIPTTYAGSEATPILGETADGRKTTQRSPKVLPEVVLYDVELTMTLPPALSVTSGFNAIAHAVEARYARERNPLISILAVEAVRALDLGPAPHRRQSARSRRAVRRALRRLGGGHLPRRGRHGAPSQDLPRARRQLQPAPCRDAHRDPAARHGLQRGGGGAICSSRSPT